MPKSVWYFIVFFTEMRSAESVKVKSARRRKRKRLQKKQKKLHPSTCSSEVEEERDAQHDGVQVNVPVSAAGGPSEDNSDDNCSLGSAEEKLCTQGTSSSEPYGE